MQSPTLQPPLPRTEAPSMAEMFVSRPLHQLYPVDSAVAHQVAAFGRMFHRLVLEEQNRPAGADGFPVSQIFSETMHQFPILEQPLAEEYKRHPGRVEIGDLCAHRVGRALEGLCRLFDKCVVNKNQLTPNDVSTMLAGLGGDEDSMLPRGLMVLSTAANYMLLALLQKQVTGMLASQNIVLKSRAHAVTSMIAPFVTNDKIAFTESSFTEMLYILASTTVQYIEPDKAESQDEVLRLPPAPVEADDK